MTLLNGDGPVSGHLAAIFQGRQGEKLQKGRAPARLRLRPRTEYSLRDAALCLGDFPDMGQALEFVVAQAGKLLKRGAYLQSFAENGVTPEMMRDALERLEARLRPAPVAETPKPL
jgi:hypothetical protein